ncbi:MAG: hypothetical protein JXR83_12360, partial [Deltaproteobacteria bacterium]|nr:hypothetical protein [Deltaproteobacteria bacterium]
LQLLVDNIELALGDSAAADRSLAVLERALPEVAARVARAGGADRRQVEQLAVDLIAANLADKRELRDASGTPFRLSEGELRRTVIDYELFKLESFVTSGVFPKRYFGYLDGRWDTAPHERTLRSTVQRAVSISNAHLASQRSPLRITDAEIAVTFLAEGGALLLRENRSRIDSVHPVFDIGLDDIATGFRAQAGLVHKLDAAFGTALGGVVVWQDGQPFLVRNFKFVEAILGTVVMWVWEKELAADQLRQAGRRPLHERTVDEQFVIGSLVYNSGLTFDDRRVKQILRFDTATYLYGVSRANRQRRPELPVLPPAPALAALLERGIYPEQPTSWAAVYHILQRYGAYVALQRCSDQFDRGGMFAVRERD